MKDRDRQADPRGGQHQGDDGNDDPPGKARLRVRRGLRRLRHVAGRLGWGVRLSHTQSTGTWARGFRRPDSDPPLVKVSAWWAQGTVDVGGRSLRG